MRVDNILPHRFGAGAILPLIVCYTGDQVDREFGPDKFYNAIGFAHPVRIITGKIDDKKEVWLFSFLPFHEKLTKNGVVFFSGKECERYEKDLQRKIRMIEDAGTRDIKDRCFSHATTEDFYYFEYIIKDGRLQRITDQTTKERNESLAFLDLSRKFPLLRSTELDGISCTACRNMDELIRDIKAGDSTKRKKERKSAGHKEELPDQFNVETKTTDVFTTQHDVAVQTEPFILRLAEHSPTNSLLSTLANSTASSSCNSEKRYSKNPTPHEYRFSF